MIVKGDKRGHCIRCGRIVGNAHFDWCDALSLSEKEIERLRATLTEIQAYVMTTSVIWEVCESTLKGEKL